MKKRVISILAASLVSIAALVGFIYFDFSNRNVTGGLSDELLETVTLTYRSAEKDPLLRDVSYARYTDQWNNEYIFYPNGELRNFHNNNQTKSPWDEQPADDMKAIDAARTYIAQLLPHLELNKYIYMAVPSQLGSHTRIDFTRGIRPGFSESILVHLDENGCLTGLGNRRTFVYSLTGKERRSFRKQYRAYKKKLHYKVTDTSVSYRYIDGKLTARYLVTLEDEMGISWSQSTTFTYEE